MQLNKTNINATIDRSCKSRTIKTFSLLQKPAKGGIPAIENKRTANVKANVIFHFLRKDQFIKNLNKNPLVLNATSNENKPKLMII